MLERNLEKVIKETGILPFTVIEPLTEEEYQKQMEIIKENIDNKDKLIELLELHYG